MAYFLKRLLIVVAAFGPVFSFAQTTGNEILEANTITTAVPFLRINPDARAGGMGDAGVAASPDVNSLYNNPSKLAFLGMDNLEGDGPDYGVSISYTPWLRALVKDIYLASLSGYYRFDDKQTLGASLRYFSLGNIQFTDANGSELGEGRPHELAFDVHYARALSPYFGVGVSLRLIYSNLAAGFSTPGQDIRPGVAGAADISMFFTRPIELKGRHTDLNFGLAITNIGSKIAYTDGNRKDFIPTNLAIGGAWEIDIDQNNEFNIYADINKLLVPTPDSAGTYKDKSPIAGMFTSFADAPGGFQEEMREFYYSVGVEYWYAKQFAVRFGYHHEHATKGNRKFLTAGLGVRYSVFGLDFSYLIPTQTQRNPLDNTLRFTLKFDFSKPSKDEVPE